MSSGHLFLSAPDGTPQLVVDSSHLQQQQSVNVETTTSEKPNTVNFLLPATHMPSIYGRHVRERCKNCLYLQQQQENIFQLQLTPAILQQLGQNSLDLQTPRQNLVHSILTQVPGQLPQIQMALAQVLPSQTESQSQVQTNTQNTSPHVLVSTDIRTIS